MTDRTVNTVDEQAAPGTVRFPFSALQGQGELQCALLLCAVDPMIGGVLIEGPRGTAKSTSARALAGLLATGTFVNLPLAASEEQVVGSLDVDAALKGEGVQFRPGLLARAHGGVLYVDEVNLLADHLVDLLLDVSASGINIIERDGISHSHPARIVLVGTMNPDEGELRLQLLDRFGLFLRIADAPDLATRQRIVATRLAFDADPAGFVAQQAEEEAALRERVRLARARLPAIDFAAGDIARVGECCSAAQVEGVRADLTLLRAARAHAALEGRTAIGEEDLARVAPWVLAHRRRDGAGAALDNPSPGEEGAEVPQGAAAAPEGAQQAAAPPAAGDGDDAPSAPAGSGPQAATRAGADPSLPLGQGGDTEWGALRAPQSAPAASVKGVRPMPRPAKKP
jgi:magnesium chelatase subunit I